MESNLLQQQVCQMLYQTSYIPIPVQLEWYNVSMDFFFFLKVSNHNHQANYFVAMVHAVYVCVAIIHQNLTWTTASLTCT